jgi:hypothetical protein
MLDAAKQTRKDEMKVVLPLDFLVRTRLVLMAGEVMKVTTWSERLLNKKGKVEGNIPALVRLYVSGATSQQVCKQPLFRHCSG